MVKKYYFINKFDTNHIVKQDTNTAFIYRNYNSKNNLSTILKIRNFCRKKKYKFFLSNNINYYFLLLSYSRQISD